MVTANNVTANGVSLEKWPWCFGLKMRRDALRCSPEVQQKKRDTAFIAPLPCTRARTLARTQRNFHCVWSSSALLSHSALWGSLCNAALLRTRHENINTTSPHFNHVNKQGHPNFQLEPVWRAGNGADKMRPHPVFSFLPLRVLVLASR